jgi:hypothetical protein
MLSIGGSLQGELVSSKTSVVDGAEEQTCKVSISEHL